MSKQRARRKLNRLDKHIKKLKQQEKNCFLLSINQYNYYFGKPIKIKQEGASRE